jgi:threonine/homoserine/homoserine lactone efflux protein
MLEVAGFELLPPGPVFLAFVLAGLALNVVPGADMAYIIASSAKSGAHAGIAAALGVGAGTLGHILLAVAGISTLIAASPILFEALKWLGGAYLLYLAIQLIRQERGAHKAAATTPKSHWATFRGGALVNLLNPKVALFFVAFLPQFVDPNAKSSPLQMLALGIWFDVVGTLVNIAIAITASGAARTARGLPWLGTFARWIAAVTFVGLAVRLVLSQPLARRAVSG